MTRRRLSWLVPTVFRTALAEVDFERAGLLDGLEGQARRSRIALLAALRGDGVTIEDMRAAIEDDRLASVALQRALMPHPARYTIGEVAEAAGVATDRAERWFRALERPVTRDATDRVFTDADVDIARRLEVYQRLGLSEDDILPVARAIGRGVSSMAEAIGSVLAARLLGGSELDPGDALRYAVEVRTIAERDSLHLAHLLAVSLSERIRSHVVAAEEHTSDGLPGAQQVAVAFADIVGFTDLGEQIEARELGELAEQLATTTTEVISPPVRLTKTIGDAVMLVSPDAQALVWAMVELARRWHNPEHHDGPERHDDSEHHRDRPPLRLGIAWGTAMPYAGDWFGAPVNLAQPAHRRGPARDRARRRHRAPSQRRRRRRMGQGPGPPPQGNPPAPPALQSPTAHHLTPSWVRAERPGPRPVHAAAETRDRPRLQHRERRFCRSA